MKYLHCERHLTPFYTSLHFNCKLKLPYRALGHTVLISQIRRRIPEKLNNLPNLEKKLFDSKTPVTTHHQLISPSVLKSIIKELFIMVLMEQTNYLKLF